MEASSNMPKPMFSFFEVEEEETMTKNAIHLHDDQVLVLKTSSQVLFQTCIKFSVKSVYSGNPRVCEICVLLRFCFCLTYQAFMLSRQ